MNDMVSVRPERASDSLADALDLIDAQIRQVAEQSESAGALVRLADLLKRKADLREKYDKARAKETQADETAAKDALLAGEDEAAVRAGIKADIRAWMREGGWDLYYVLATDCWWLLDATKGDWMSLKEHALRMSDVARMRNGDYFALFDEVLREDGRWYLRMTASFRPQAPHVLNLIRPDFAPPQEGEPHWVFDVLMKSLSGGKTENSEHIERLVLAKWRNPANHLLPALSFHDPEGGSGKSLFVSTVLVGIFGRSLVGDNLSMRDLTGQFNSHTVGKAVIFINEAVEDKSDENAVKGFLGSKTLWVEPKGLTKYEVENTAWVVIAGNSPMGSVKVAGSEVDRRISVVKPTRPLKCWVAAHLGATEAAAEQWMRDEGGGILADRVEVGRWLSHLLAKHGEVDHVPALHGEDYRDLVSAQRPFHEQVFDTVFRDPSFTYIRKPVLYLLYRDACRDLNASYGLLKNRSLYRHLEVWLSRQKLGIVERKVKWCGARGETTADVLYAPARFEAEPSRLTDNDDEFFLEDERTGRRVWRVQVG
ncbi:MAG: hypothetical protein JWP57_4520 [Spirosoma sp.]|nr:hypothetical protein [Spirosoma sp.]